MYAFKLLIVEGALYILLLTALFYAFFFTFLLIYKFYFQQIENAFTGLPGYKDIRVLDFR